MTIDVARGFFLWCSIINYGLLFLWFGLVIGGRDWLYRLWARWFALPREQFEALNAIIVGVSTDTVERHYAFAEKHAFPFILLADTDGKLASAFGVLNGKLASRSTFILDHDLHLRRTFLDVTPRGHAQNVLNFLRTLVESYRMLGG